MLGMETYQFGEELDLGHIVDVAVDEDGDILLLAYNESRASIVRCDFRGRPKSTIELWGLPIDFLDFSPNRMIYRQGSLYFASTSGLKVVVTDREGNFRNGYDIFSLLELEEKDRGTVEIFGFSVDEDRNILMTVPVLFRAFTMSPAGEVKYFGDHAALMPASGKLPSASSTRSWRSTRRRPRTRRPSLSRMRS